MTETLAKGYSSESAQRELSNEYQHGRVQMVFKNLCIFVPWMKVASALEGLTYIFHPITYDAELQGFPLRVGRRDKIRLSAPAQKQQVREVYETGLWRHLSQLSSGGLRWAQVGVLCGMVIIIGM